MKLPKLLAGLAVASVALAACGTSGGGGTGNKGTIKIGVDLPESGAAASSGLPTLHGVEFAVKQANDAGGVEGFKLEVSNFDDAVSGSYNEQKGVQNVSAMVGDSKVLAMVGPFNSAVAKAEIPVTNAAGLTMISPSNTNPCLTKDLPTCSYHPQDLRKGKPNNYFRVVATDDLQGPAAADYAFKKLNISKIAVLSDSTVFGKGIADTFQERFKSLGGTVVLRDNYDPASTHDWRSFLTRAKSGGAGGLYVGGTDDKEACQPRPQMKTVGWNAPYFGGDGIETTQCIDDAGDNALDISATSAGAEATQIPAAASTIQAYKKQFPGANDYGTYTIAAYDAANIEIAALKQAIKANNGNMPSREQVRAEVAKTSDFKGVIGTHTFDSNGDTSVKIISMYTTKEVTADKAKDDVCGKTKPTTCFDWVTQFNFGASS